MRNKIQKFSAIPLAAVLLGYGAFLNAGTWAAPVSPESDAKNAFRRTAQRTRYEFWGSNPFVLQKDTPAQSFSGLVLNGIAYDVTRPAAIINDKIVKAGDNVETYQVVKIYPNRVVMTDGTSTFEIELNPNVARKKS